MKRNRFLKSFTSLLIVLAMLVYAFPVSILAISEENSSLLGAEYTLQVYIPKNTVGEISFYPTLGFDEENRDFFESDTILTCNVDFDTDTKYDIYTIFVPEGLYSFRATDLNGNSLGGGVINVPTEVIVDSGEEESYEITAYLKLCHTYITNQYDGEKATAGDFSVTLTNKLGTVTMGDPVCDERGNFCYPALVYANGNALLYYATFTPSEEYAGLHQVKETQSKNIAVFKGNKVQNIKTALSDAIPFTIIAPSGSQVAMYEQGFNFNTTKTEPASSWDNGDGTTSFWFPYPRSSYRVSLDGYRTQAGYIPEDISEAESTLEVSFGDGAVDAETDGGIGRKESGVLLNINERNKLSLDVGETYKVRAYRAPWQIINTDSDNIMIEPDFHFNILSGETVIEIQETDGGNASGNWAEVTAINEGVAIVEVTYDAIDVAWSDKTETYGATNPRRSGVFVVTVGSEYGDVYGVDLDCEYHTEYFTGDSGILTVMPQGNHVRVEVANVWQGTIRTWKNIVGNYGSFEVPIANGNNILKITADGVTDYRIVRGSKLETVITNHTNPRRTESVCPGDELTVGFKGLFQWIPKFSGIYNPSRVYATYELNGQTVESVRSQYELPETTMSITVPADATELITLTNGKLTGNSLGSVWSAHRQLTDAGVPANFNASGIPLEDLALPDLVISVVQPDASEDNNTNDDAPSDEWDDGLPEIDEGGIDVSNLEFDLSSDEITGYVTVSFQDNGIRKPNESNVTYEIPLGEMIPPVSVPITEEDTIATVTLRLLEALNIKASYTGRPANNFYLVAIGNFSLQGEYYESFGEFDAGAASGWMVRQNQWFINMGASEFPVEDGDRIEWLYTCRLGADIGCDWSNPSAEITGIRFLSDYGTLSPQFSEEVTEYTYTVDGSFDSVCLSADVANYWSTVSYQSGNAAYKPMEAIPVSDGTVILIESAYARYAGDEPSHSDRVQITIRQYSDDGITDESETQEPEEQKTEQTTEDTRVQEKPPFSETTFSDVTTDDWHYTSVKYVYENNLMQGTGNGFEPDAKMSRAMLVTVLYRMAKPKTVNDLHRFTDVMEDEWYRDAVSWAAENGIVNGITPTEFAPHSELSREQMALILYRFAKLQGYDVSDKADVSVFTDAGDVSEWALDAICWANKTELINGTGETTLSPKGSATRAQVAAILMRFLENVAK